MSRFSSVVSNTPYSRLKTAIRAPNVRPARSFATLPFSAQRVWKLRSTPQIQISDLPAVAPVHDTRTHWRDIKDQTNVFQTLTRR